MNWNGLKFTIVSNWATNAPKVDVKVDGKWLSLSLINNIDYNGYAGIPNKPMTTVAIKVGKGSIRYRIHAKGKGWYPWVTGYNTNDFYNGYAGDSRNVIDGIQIEFDDGSNKVWYRSSAVGNGSWTVGNKVLTGAMDKLQIAISRTNPF